MSNYYLQQKINERYPKEHIIVLNYIAMKDPATVMCEDCQRIYTLKVAENFIRKDKKCICRKCVNKQLKIDSFQEEINEKYPQENLKILDYELKDKSCSIQCLSCGEIYQLQNAGRFLEKSKKRVCKKCFPNKRKQIEDTYLKFLKYIQESNDFVLMEKKDIKELNSKTLIKCQCLHCGKINEKTMYNYLSGKKCLCTTSNRLLSKKEYQDWIGKEYTALSEYKGKEHSIMMKHNLCGFCYKTNARHYHCPKCSGSKGEKKIAFLLKEKNIEYIREFKVNIHKHDLRFDFYLPKEDCFIEYQGKQHSEPIPYFGGEKAFKKQQEYDALKREWIKTHGYVLLEINYNEDIEKKLLNYLLKFNDHPQREE